MTRPSLRPTLVLATVALIAGACAGTMRPTRFTNPDFDFGFLQRVAVIPFENFTSDRQAGPRATRTMITELLASGAIDVVEPGEVQAALDKLGPRITAPSTEQIVALGKSLGVQGVVLGSVTQSEVVRSGAVGIPVVGLDVHLVETETGAAVWASTHTERGGGFGARVLGTGGEPIAETTRAAVRRLIRTLVEE